MVRELYEALLNLLRLVRKVIQNTRRYRLVSDSLFPKFFQWWESFRSCVRKISSIWQAVEGELGPCAESFWKIATVFSRRWTRLLECIFLLNQGIQDLSSNLNEIYGNIFVWRRRQRKTFLIKLWEDIRSMDDTHDFSNAWSLPLFHENSFNSNIRSTTVYHKRIWEVKISKKTWLRDKFFQFI